MPLWEAPPSGFQELFASRAARDKWEHFVSLPADEQTAFLWQTSLADIDIDDDEMEEDGFVVLDHGRRGQPRAPRDAFRSIDRRLRQTLKKQSPPLVSCTVIRDGWMCQQQHVVCNAALGLGGGRGAGGADHLCLCGRPQR
jgi:hypothetical protein